MKGVSRHATVGKVLAARSGQCERSTDRGPVKARAHVEHYGSIFSYDAASPRASPRFYTITFANGRPAKRREPGDAQLLQDFQRHVQRWPGPVWRVQLAGVKPGLREPARNPSTPRNLSRRRAGLGGNVISYIQVASTSSLTFARGKSRRSRGVDDVSGAWAAPGGSTSYRQPRQAIHGV